VVLAEGGYKDHTVLHCRHVVRGRQCTNAFNKLCPYMRCGLGRHCGMLSCPAHLWAEAAAAEKAAAEARGKLPA
jgi:hypothetical protein